MSALVSGFASLSHSDVHFRFLYGFLLVLPGRLEYRSSLCHVVSVNPCSGSSGETDWR